MSTIDKSMTFFNGVPKPLRKNLDNTQANGDNSSDDFFLSPLNDQRIKNLRAVDGNTLLGYDVTIANMDYMARDISLPFEYLAFFENSASFSLTAPFLPATKILPEHSAYTTKLRLTEIKLKILNKTHKGESLQDIPDLIARSISKISYATLKEILPTLMEVIWSWINSVRVLHWRRLPRKFYATNSVQKFDFENLGQNLKVLFDEGFHKCKKPCFENLVYSHFQQFLDKFSISYTGPFRTSSNGQNYIAVFTSGKIKCLKFFNRNKPLFGILEFKVNNETIVKGLEPLPEWFYKSENRV